jgi:hypothetical protein
VLTPAVRPDRGFLIADPGVEAFKERTRNKMRGVCCPLHHQQPRIRFEGRTLRDIRVSMSACCEQLARIANKAIALP